MTPQSIAMVALRLACLLIAAYLALRGIAWLAPKIAGAAQSILRGI